MKDRGQEPTYPALVAANPKALMNPTTNKPVAKNAVYTILRKRCYDDVDDPGDTWSHEARFSQTALTEASIKQRSSWANMMQKKRHSGQWYYDNLVWTDICNSILPRTTKRHQEMVLARKGNKGWMSSKSKRTSKNLKGKASARKQNSWDSVKVWWAPVLTRGKLHIEMLGEGFPGEKPNGAAILVSKVRTALNIRFRSDDKPAVLFVDRGQGFYRTRGGKITEEFKNALNEHSLKAFNGDDASAQPGNLQDFLLHETAVSWIRYREQQNRMKEPWKETLEEFGARMRQICQDINENLDVEGLCRAMPKRLRELIEHEGDRTPH